MTTEALLRVDQLEVVYGGPRRPRVQAVRNVNFIVEPGETLAIVGESGSGKSTTAGAVLGLVPVTSGSISYRGRDITHLPEKQRRGLSSEIQAVFQNPVGSFNPARRVLDAVIEPLLAPSPDRGHLTKRDREERGLEMLAKVGLSGETGQLFPKQLSGGQLQRLAIARALISEPALVVLDEALSSLDLSVQAQIINLLISLREEMNLTYLFIGHDLDVVKYLAHRVMVLYRGEVVETGLADEVCVSPEHPYTQRLLSSVPVPDPVIQRQRRANGGLSALSASPER